MIEAISAETAAEYDHLLKKNLKVLYSRYSLFNEKNVIIDPNLYTGPHRARLRLTILSEI